MFDESCNSFMTQIALAQELETLEASMARMDEADPNEVDQDEYKVVLGRIVKLRELLEKKCKKCEG